MEPLTHEETRKANGYIATLGPDKMQQKLDLLEKFKQGPDVFNPLIRSLI